jgi:hypothetical protein
MNLRQIETKATALVRDSKAIQWCQGPKTPSRLSPESGNISPIKSARDAKIHAELIGATCAFPRQNIDKEFAVSLTPEAIDRRVAWLIIKHQCGVSSK